MARGRERDNPLASQDQGLPGRVQDFVTEWMEQYSPVAGESLVWVWCNKTGFLVPYRRCCEYIRNPPGSSLLDFLLIYFEDYR